MSKTLSDLGATFLLGSNAMVKRVAARESDMAHFRQVAHTYFPAASETFVRTVAEEIVRRGDIICKTSIADPDKVVPFLLEACRIMLHRGARIEDIASKLPRDMNGLGMLVLEMNINPNTGKPLTDRELRAANNLGKIKLQ